MNYFVIFLIERWLNCTFLQSLDCGLVRAALQMCAMCVGSP